MIEYEYALMSCLLNKPEYLVYASSVKKEYFEDEACQEIYNSLVTIERVSFPKVVRSLEGRIEFKKLLPLLDIVKLPTKTNVEYYAYLVIEGYKDREIKSINSTNLADIEAKINELKKIGVYNQETDRTSDVFCQELERVFNHEPDLNLIPTGFSVIDEKIKGFSNSQLIIIGARPAMGKSTIALNMAYNMAVKQKKVLFFSLEMSSLELHKRLVKLVSGYKNYYNLSVEQFNKLVNISKRIAERLPLKIIDKGENSIEDIFFQCRKYKDRGELDIVFIDHLSILKSKKTFKSRYEEISEISRKLKIMAKDLNVPVVALCQLNRGIEKEENKTPTMADLRDSGSIEQDADLICFLHRPEYYIEMKGNEVLPEQKGVAYFVISKNRHGSVGRVNLMFNREIPTFYEG